jgi:hypothetical protein
VRRDFFTAGSDGATTGESKLGIPWSTFGNNGTCPEATPQQKTRIGIRKDEMPPCLRCAAWKAYPSIDVEVFLTPALKNCSLANFASSYWEHYIVLRIDICGRAYNDGIQLSEVSDVSMEA